MKSFLSKINATVAGGVVVLAGCVLAGLGLTVIGLLAIFALAAFGLALLVRPFLEMSREQADDETADMFREERSVA